MANSLDRSSALVDAGITAFHTVRVVSNQLENPDQIISRDMRLAHLFAALGIELAHIAAKQLCRFDACACGTNRHNQQGLEGFEVAECFITAAQMKVELLPKNVTVLELNVHTRELFRTDRDTFQALICASKETMQELATGGRFCTVDSDAGIFLAAVVAKLSDDPASVEPALRAGLRRIIERHTSIV